MIPKAGNVCLFLFKELLAAVAASSIVCVLTGR